GTRDERYPGFPAGSRWSTSARSPAPSPTRRWCCRSSPGPMTGTGCACPPPTSTGAPPPRAGIRGMRVAYGPDLGYAAVDPEVRQIADRAAQVFERDLGCIVERAGPG